MTTETIDHGTLSRLVEAGAVRGAHIVGQGSDWSIMVQYGIHERPLATRGRQVRRFRKLETLVSYLKRIGIARFDVDAASYHPSGTPKNARPDRSRALKRAHEAAAHEKWFLEQVEIGLAEADDPATQWITQEQAGAMWEKQRAELSKRVERSDS